jgi:hypothetical protein
MTYGVNYPSKEELLERFEYIDDAKTQHNGYLQMGALLRICGRKAGTLVFGTLPSKNARAAVGWTENKKTRLLHIHRVVWIMHSGNVSENLVIDHISGNPRDNRIGNLRAVSPSENQMNRRSSRVGAKCKYIGVCVSGVKYNAFVSCAGKPVFLGAFRDPVDAAIARDLEVGRRYSSAATLNRNLFPEVMQEYQRRSQSA